MSFVFTFTLGELDNPITREMSTTEIILFGIIVVPLLETMLFQTLPIWGLRALIKRPRYNLIPCILVSAIAFGFEHPFGWQYVLYGFFMGIGLATLYYLCIYRRQSAFYIVSGFHALWNTIAFIFD